MIVGSIIRKMAPLFPAVLGFLLMLGTFGCSTSSAIAIDIGIDNSPVNSLIIVAKEQGYFREQGLDVTLRSYASGLNAVDALLAGEVDVATASEFVLAGKALQGESIRALASISSVRHIFLCCRKDRGIEQPSDLTGKRIGVPMNTAAEFFLGHYLYLNGLSISDVTMININPDQTAAVLASGDMDAVVAWQPNVMAVERLLGDAVTIWPAQSDRPLYALTISRTGLIEAYPDVVESYLRALKKAEGAARKSPADSMDLTAAYLGIEEADMEVLWPLNTFLLTLDQGLILALEDEARWMMNNNPATKGIMPEFLDYIYADGLKEIKPEAVDIIRNEDSP